VSLPYRAAMPRFGDGLRPCDAENMLNKSDWQFSTLWPCTFAPLTLTVVGVIYAWCRLWKEWGASAAIPRKATVAVLVMESVVCIACFVQCIVVSDIGTWVGGISSCNFQSWYVGFNLVTYPFLLGLLSLFTRIALQNVEDARFAALRRRPGLAFAACIVWGAFIAAWPALGIVPDGYVFADVYCSYNLYQPAQSGLYLASLVFLVACLFLGACHLLRTPEAPAGKLAHLKPEGKCCVGIRCLCIGMIALAVFTQMLPVAIVIVGFTGTNDTCDGSIAKYLLTGFAPLGHTTSLISAWFAIVWRRELTARLAATGSDVGLPTQLTAPPTNLVVDMPA